MIYNFDEIINREGTGCIKYDVRKKVFGKSDVLPLWVADMDFKTPDFVINALKERLEHEILGYSFRTSSYNNSIVEWQMKRHQWKIQKDWLSFAPGVVTGLALAVESFSSQGDEVILQPPVYPPFFNVILNTGRKVVENPLKKIEGRYTFDLEDLKKKITPSTKMLILCNPHNPGGMVWKRQELTDLANICMENKIMMVSDEIHSDIIYKGNKHTPLASLSKEIADHCVVFMASSKTFNVAGLSTAYVIIPDVRLLGIYKNTLNREGLSLGNIMGNVALESAYRNGEDWLEQLLDYLQNNISFIDRYLKENLPKVIMMKPEATFLAWLDFSAFELDDEEIKQRIINSGVGLNPGIDFGKQGSGYMRLNFGCPRSV
ncbi:MAG: PatB family C-S lyase, partial [Prolixibacteraceae bacterium]|nr:PatB family C-S lyase [Prolixibacteraceae bacterium]